MSGLDLTALTEAAARAHFQRVQSQRRDDGRFLDDGVTPIGWEHLRPIDQHAFREFVLPIVTAVTRCIQATEQEATR